MCSCLIVLLYLSRVVAIHGIFGSVTVWFALEHSTGTPACQCHATNIYNCSTKTTHSSAIIICALSHSHPPLFKANRSRSFKIHVGFSAKFPFFFLSSHYRAILIQKSRYWNDRWTHLSKTDHNCRKVWRNRCSRSYTASEPSQWLLQGSRIESVWWDIQASTGLYWRRSGSETVTHPALEEADGARSMEYLAIKIAFCGNRIDITKSKPCPPAICSCLPVTFVKLMLYFNNLSSTLSQEVQMWNWPLVSTFVRGLVGGSRFKRCLIANFSPCHCRAEL